jgi:hypothetical protein
LGASRSAEVTLVLRELGVGAKKRDVAVAADGDGGSSSGLPTCMSVIIAGFLSTSLRPGIADDSTLLMKDEPDAALATLGLEVKLTVSITATLAWRVRLGRRTTGRPASS